ncbi:MAG: hypothetical protein ABSB59_43510 [Streptosporangiaceae bacterium]
MRCRGGRPRVVRIGHEAARTLDRYLRIRSRQAQAWRPGRGGCLDAPVPAPFSHTWLDRGGAEGDLMELNGWSSPQMLEWYGGTVRGARARRHYDLIMRD